MSAFRKFLFLFVGVALALGALPGIAAAGTPDTTAPTSKASAVAVTTSHVITVSYTASDPGGSSASGLAKVDLYAKAPGQTDYKLSATDYSGLPSGSFNYQAPAHGTYAFYTRATDKATPTPNVEAAPSSADATTQVVAADVSAPWSKATGPAVSTSRTVKVAYTAGDDLSGIASVALWAKGPTDGVFRQVGVLYTKTGTFTYTAAIDGTFAFFTIATDKATPTPNVEAVPASPDVTTEVETTVPASQASAPRITNQSTFMVSYSVVHPAPGTPAGVTGVSLWVLEPGATAWRLYATNTNPTSSAFAFTAASGVDGAYAFVTQARDWAGNTETMATTPDTVTIVDRVAPKVSGVKAWPNPFSLGRQGQTTLVFWLDSGAKVRINILRGGVVVRHLIRAWVPKGKVVRVWKGYSDAGHRVSPGIYTIRIRAIDRAGNRTMQQITLTVRR